MLNSAEKKRYPLHIHIASLVTILVLLVGITLAWVSYRQISDLALETTEASFRKTIDLLELQYQKEYRPVATSIRLLASAAIAEANSLEERMQHLPILAEVIRDEPQIAGFQIGYEDGDYFIMRPLNTDHMRSMFEAPEDAVFMIDHIDHHQSGESRQVRIFLAEQLEPIGQAIYSKTGYDPRQRPWYQTLDSAQGLKITSPYLFFFTRKVGITVSRFSERGNSTVAADITLDSFSSVLRQNSVTPSTFSLLFNSDNEVLSYNTAGGALFGQFTQDAIPRLEDLPISLAEQLQGLSAGEGEVLPFSYDGEQWLGTVREISTKSKLSIKLLTAAPEHELLASAFEARRTSILIIAAVVLLVLPIAWFFANQIARPLRRLAQEARSIADFNFDSALSANSIVSEVNQLSSAMDSMRLTISNFFNLITSLSAESDINRLLDRVTDETLKASGAGAAVIYLLADDETRLVAQPLRLQDGKVLDAEILAAESIDLKDGSNSLVESFNGQNVRVEVLDKGREEDRHLLPLFEAMDADKISAVIVPLADRNKEGTGLLCLLYPEQDQGKNFNPEHIGFVEALSGFAEVSMESRQLLKTQKDLLQSFIEVIADAIDAKSPYTGGHCQRVPMLTKMLAAAACDSMDPRFAEFSLSETEWEELHIAAWLHDCGKVTTPEYVVDKATKLETIYDRIHEVRMRFEVLKRDAEIEFWRGLSDGGDRQTLQQQLDLELSRLDDDFAFIGTCNEGGEFMAAEKLERLNVIAARTWRRTLSDRIGISWEEGLRKQRVAEPELPVEESLIADKQEHVFYRDPKDIMPEDNPWKFRFDTPEHLYNKGELYNLSVARGTLAPEERFKINDHMVQTIIMLNQLPFPKHLRNVPAIAGGHHETMIGTGYPMRLGKEDMSLTARMMAIADIFEALTAADRPYKKAKSLSESVKIMSFMKKDQHIDPDLFELFLQSGVYLDYAKRFLDEEQIDEVDIAAYMDADSR
jgi:HD-GYP domain-containing protein (c-di-GMP phosphodiesterase class II)